MIFVDANLIVALFAANHEFHSRAVAFMDAETLRKQYFVISPQVVGEAFVTTTSSRLFKKPATPAHFRKQLSLLRDGGGILLVSPGEKAVEYALAAAEEFSITSARIFDLIIYGTMREHGITRIATFNEKDFRNLDGIELVPIP